MRVVALAISIVVTLSCSGAGSFGTSGDDKDGTTKAKSDNDKPTEGSEGVPGYLTDPGAIAVLESGDKLAITVPSSGVEIVGDAGQPVEVRALGTTSDLLRSVDPEGDITAVEANVLDRATVEAGKNIELDVLKPTGSQVLILEVAYASDPDQVRLRDADGERSNNAVFSSGINKFSSFSRADIVNTDIELSDETTTTETAGDGGDSSEEATVDEDEGEPAPCNGKRAGDGCWYLAGLDVSCVDYCASHGGYSLLTETYVGSSGTFSQCLEVANLVMPSHIKGISAKGCGFGVGCFAQSIVVQRCEDPTNGTDKVASFQRICACNQ